MFIDFPFLHSGLMCKVSAGNEVACLTTNHLAALAKLEPRLVPLVLAFRYWARVRLQLTLTPQLKEETIKIFLCASLCPVICIFRLAFSKTVCLPQVLQTLVFY